MYKAVLKMIFLSTRSSRDFDLLVFAWDSNKIRGELGADVFKETTSTEMCFKSNFNSGNLVVFANAPVAPDFLFFIFL